MGASLADALLRRYIRLRDANPYPSRELGEQTHRSPCCAAPLTRRKGLLACSQCRQLVQTPDVKIGAHTLRNRPDATDRRLAAHCDRWLWLQTLICSPEPPISIVVWAHSLAAWETSIDARLSSFPWEDVCRQIAKMGSQIGNWTLPTGPLVESAIGTLRLVVSHRYGRSSRAQHAIGPVGLPTLVKQLAELDAPDAPSAA